MLRNSLNTRTSTLLLLALATSTSAQSTSDQTADQLAQQQAELMRQYIEAAGMPEEQIKQAEQIAIQNAAPVAAQEKREIAAERSEFDAKHSASGTAQFTLNGKNYEYPITRCSIDQPQAGSFSLEAREPPGVGRGQLNLKSDSHYKRVELRVTNGDGFWDQRLPLDALRFDEGMLEWSGEIEGDWKGKETGEKAAIVLVVNCKEPAQ